MTTETLPEHVRRPHIRPVQPIQVQKEGKVFAALRDPLMLTQQTLVVAPQAVQVLQAFQGKMTIEELAERFKAPLEQFVQLAEALEKVGLLWGPTFEKLEGQWKKQITERGAFPATCSTTLGKDAAECRQAIRKFFDDTEDPELDEAPRGLVAPHLDYQRGWPNYATAYYPLQRMKQKPDRVVVLGTNHFGLGDGVVMSEHGFFTPLGKVRPDKPLVDAMIDKLGRPLVIDQLDHLAEHSVELQLPFIQYCLGDVPVLGVLVPDPLNELALDQAEAETETEAAEGSGAGESRDDGASPTNPRGGKKNERIGYADFVSALRDSLQSLGGNTFVVASSDLSHVGPQFGEPRKIDDQRRFDVERHDREMLGKYVAGDVDDFLSAMKWNQNPTRWCSIGNMTAALSLLEPETIELLDYRQATDENGMVLVSSAAIAFC